MNLVESFRNNKVLSLTESDEPSFLVVKTLIKNDDKLVMSKREFSKWKRDVDFIYSSDKINRSYNYAIITTKRKIKIHLHQLSNRIQLTYFDSTPTTLKSPPKIKSRSGYGIFGNGNNSNSPFNAAPQSINSGGLLLPIAMNIASKPIGMGLVGVSPIPNDIHYNIYLNENRLIQALVDVDISYFNVEDIIDSIHTIMRDTKIAYSISSNLDYNKIEAAISEAMLLKMID